MFAIIYQEPKKLAELNSMFESFVVISTRVIRKIKWILVTSKLPTDFFSHFLDIFDSIYHSVAFLQTDNSLLKAERWSAGRFARSRT